ncbi:MAG: hypothetical protein Q9218_007675 [Villophora microphyllina]
MQSAANGIPLCPNCHDLFDAHDFPGFTLFPVDIQFFVDYEKQDFERRRKQYEATGLWTLRVVPTAQDYLQHQASLVPPEASGGLYRRMFLIESGGPNGRIGETLPPKPWHGCPLAAFSRAFHSMGSQSHLFPREVRQQLRGLKDLYSDHDQMCGAIPTMRALPIQEISLSESTNTANYNTAFPYQSYTAAQSQPQNLGVDHTGATEGTDGKPADGTNAMPDDEPSRKRARSDDGCADNSAKRQLLDTRMAWKWGPITTSEDKASFYQGIRSLRNKAKTAKGTIDSVENQQQQGKGESDATGDSQHSDTKEHQHLIEALLPSPRTSHG